MDFKRVHLDVNDNRLITMIKPYEDSLDAIESYYWSLEKDVLVVKIQKRKKSEIFGVPNIDGTSDSLSDLIDEEQICELEFVVIFTYTNTIYYTGNKKEVSIVVKNFFKINNVNFLPNINLEDFSELSKIIITDNKPYQATLEDDNNRLNTVRAISELADPINTSKIKTEFDVRIKGSTVFSQKLSDFINKQPAGIEIGFHGYNKQGKKIFYSANQSMLKVSVFEKNLTHKERQQIKEKQILSELQNAIGDGKDAI